MGYRLLTLSIVVGCVAFLVLPSDRLRGVEPEWSPVPGAMLTTWGEHLQAESAWQEYPRPQMVRPKWTNLNGLWDVAVTDRQADQPTNWEDQILVPFALEAPLSGIGRRLTPDQALWYHRSFQLDARPTERLLLHFEAVDYRTEVWVNGQSVGEHVGGNLPFAFDIAQHVRAGTNEVVLRVIDQTDAPNTYQLRGKQKTENGGIWYTPVSGIWQTVWLEPVPTNGIKRLKIQSDAEGHVKVSIAVFDSAQTTRGVSVRAFVQLDGKVVARNTGPASGVEVEIPHPKLWSPASPTLYPLTIELLGATGTIVDKVTSYVGLREIGRIRDAQGNWRLTLNGNVLFHWGTLDQGWWPDGLLTPPSDAGMASDIQFLKRAGFNMIRKHIKVEPRRYYYHCDRLGMLVWQDQVSGGLGVAEGHWPKWRRLAADHPGNRSKRAAGPDDPLDAVWPEPAHRQYMVELQGMIDNLYNSPAIVTWIPFNERWGQHRSLEVGQWIKNYDPSRYLNVASGGNFFPIGDLADEHNYPMPTFPMDDPQYADYVKIVGEFGGHGWPEIDHLWDKKKRNWGYGGLPKTKAEYIGRFEETAQRLGQLKQAGVAGAVYTQTTDVEGELNGLITYDRKVQKIAPQRLRKIVIDAGIVED